MTTLRPPPKEASHCVKHASTSWKFPGSLAYIALSRSCGRTSSSMNYPCRCDWLQIFRHRRAVRAAVCALVIGDGGKRRPHSVHRNYKRLAKNYKETYTHGK